MINPYMAMGSALYYYLSQVGTIPVYGNEASQGSAYPYIRFARLSETFEYTFTSAAIAGDYVVEIVSNRTYPDDEAYPLWTHVGTAMQNAPLQITGYRLKRCEARSLVEYRDNEKFWHVGCTYRIEAHAE